MAMAIRGREALDEVYAYAFGAEDALVRHNFVCGTHALTVALFGVLRPGDTMLSVTGLPYDTLQSAIGLTGDGNGSLREFGIRYEQVDLKEDGTPDYDEIARRVQPGLKMVVHPALPRLQPAPLPVCGGNREDCEDCQGKGA